MLPNQNIFSDGLGTVLPTIIFFSEGLVTVLPTIIFFSDQLVTRFSVKLAKKHDKMSAFSFILQNILSVLCFSLLLNNIIGALASYHIIIIIKKIKKIQKNSNILREITCYRVCFF